MIRVFPDARLEGEQFDLLVVALGYETRSSFAAKKFGAQCARHVAIEFLQRKVGSYSANREFYRSNNYLFLEFSSDFMDLFYKTIAALLLEIGHSPKIMVDISSMSRPMIALVVVALRNLSALKALEVTFIYCPAGFTKPSERFPVTVSEPVIPELAGWSLRPERSVAAIVGLGFEPDQALGTIEFLEPAGAWIFIPHGESKKFDSAVSDANADLIQQMNSQNIVRYDIKDPYECFVQVEALTYGLLADTRPVLVPFGPKLFALICVLVGVVHEPSVAVWRVSGDQEGAPDDRKASGNVIPLRTLFSA